jgi:hypothetical protein
MRQRSFDNFPVSFSGFGKYPSLDENASVDRWFHRLTRLKKRAKPRASRYLGV